jgi:DNA polymerase-4
VNRSVLNVDIAAFPVAVARVVEPGLAARPVVVAPPGSSRPLVIAVSSEAAGEGIRVGMPVPAAVRRCPGLVVLPADWPLCRRAAAAVLALLGGYSPLVEPAAAGQAFLDLTGTARLFGAAKDVAARVRREIEARLRLRATVGVATSKLVSRVAARVVRPDGLCDVFPGSEAPFLAPLPVLLLPEARDEVRERLEDLSIVQVSDLLALSPSQARFALGWRGDRLYRQAQGVDDSPVRPPEGAPTVREEETLAEDSNEEEPLLRALCLLCERAGARLRRLPAAPRRLRVEMRYSDGASGRREGRLAAPTAADLLLFRAARDLFERARARRVRVRGLALVCLDLVRGLRQPSLFGPEAFGGEGFAASRGAAETLAEAIDRIRGRFGGKAIVAGRILTRAGAALEGRR